MGNTVVERKLAAIVSADVAGFSRLMENDETQTLADLSASRAIIDDLVKQRNGRLVNTAGDSFLVEFPSVIEAVQCAVDIQEAVCARGRGVSEDRQMLLRIGINVGDVMLKDGDIFGDGVNVAARLQGLAPPGGILISRAVHDQLRDKTTFVFEDHGEQSLKNISRAIHVFGLGDRDGAPVDALPASASQASTDQDMELAFWTSIADSEQKSDYDAYLERYPDGNFISLARARLSTLGTAAELSSEDKVKLEIAFWESVKTSDDPEAMQHYLDKYPQGHFAELAQAQMKRPLGQ